MTSKLETPETIFLEAFQKAWKLVVKDYDARLINGEHTMQASLYRHLLQELPKKNEYSVFTEAMLTFKDKDIENRKFRKIDLLISRQRPAQIPEVIAAIELKFKPRVFPDMATVKKDLLSLSLIRNRRANGDRIDLTMDRFEANDHTMKFDISSQRKLIFATFCRADIAATKKSLDANSFWEIYRPEKSHWSGVGRCPPALGLAFAMTSKTGKTDSKFFGPAFED